MKAVEFDRVCYRVNGEPVFLYSGEFHYFRVPREDWRRRMELFREAGGNCLATYVPWLLHEPREGEFDFGESDPQSQLDMGAFFRLAAELGLYVIARPGPYQYSELKYNGLPTWLCDNYPSIRARTIDGKAFRVFSVSYLHPLFLEKVRTWFGQVCPRIAKACLQPDGANGSVAFVQVDNEMGGVHWWISGHDYNHEAMGIGQSKGYYPEFLRRRYGKIEELNRLYAAGYAAFEDVRPRELKASSDPAHIRQARDYYDFYNWTMGEYARQLAGLVRSHGISVPIVHNSPNPSSNAQFREMVEAVPAPFLLGSDHYYNLGQSWPQNNPTPQYALSVFLSNEMLRLMGFPPTVYELPGGSAADWPPFLPHDARACYLANVALGMKGANFYIFTGGPNPPGAGTTTDLYDYNAAVGALGEVRPLYDVIKEVGLFLRDRRWLAEAQRIGDCRVGLDFEYARAEKYWNSAGGQALTSTDAWKFLRRGVLTSAFCGGLSPVCCDLDSDDWVGDYASPLIVAASPAMSRRKQERLVAYVRKGGRLLIGPVVPSWDEQFEPCTVLADALNAPVMRKQGNDSVRLTIAGVVNVCNSGSVYFASATPACARVIGHDEYSGQPVALQMEVGAGQVIILGFQWDHSMREHVAMLRGLLDLLGLRPVVENSNPNIWTSLRSDGRRHALFLMNLLSSPGQTATRCRIGQSWWDSGVHELEPMTVKVIEHPA